MEQFRKVGVRGSGGFNRVVAAIAVAGMASVASATPPAMGAITFPVTTASIVTAVVTAGGLLLVAYFAPKVGFSFAKKLLSRLHRSV